MAQKLASDTYLIMLGQLDQYVVFGTKSSAMQEFQRGKGALFGVIFILTWFPLYCGSTCALRNHYPAKIMQKRCVSDRLRKVHTSIEVFTMSLVWLFIFSCPQQLNRWPCHSLTNWGYFYFWHYRVTLETCDLWDIWSEWWGNNFLTISTMFDIFWQFQQFSTI